MKLCVIYLNLADIQLFDNDYLIYILISEIYFLYILKQLFGMDLIFFFGFKPKLLGFKTTIIKGNTK